MNTGVLKAETHIVAKVGLYQLTLVANVGVFAYLQKDFTVNITNCASSIIGSIPFKNFLYNINQPNLLY